MRASGVERVREFGDPARRSSLSPEPCTMRNSLISAALAVALSALLGACMQNAPTTPEQAQYLATLRSCPPGLQPIPSPIGNGGYRCVLDQ